MSSVYATNSAWGLTRKNAGYPIVSGERGSFHERERPDGTRAEFGPAGDQLTEWDRPVCGALDRVWARVERGMEGQ